jgi:WD40 repeat protein
MKKIKLETAAFYILLASCLMGCATSNSLLGGDYGVSGVYGIMSQTLDISRDDEYGLFGDINMSGFGAFMSIDMKFLEMESKVVNLNKGNASSLNFGIAALGRLPLNLGPVALFPLAGLSFEYRFGDSSSRLKSGFWSGLTYGVGMDLSLGDTFFLQSELLFDRNNPLSLLLKGPQQSATTFKFAVGYRFIEKESSPPPKKPDPPPKPAPAPTPTPQPKPVVPHIDQAIIARDPAGGQEIRVLPSTYSNTSGLSYVQYQDGLILAYVYGGSGSDKAVNIWDAASGTLEQTISPFSYNMRASAVSPDFRYIATSQWEGSLHNDIRIIDTDSNRIVRVLSGHTNNVVPIVFTPDGKRIVSGGHDNTIKVWDVASGRLERTLTGHTNTIFSLATSPDGKRVASASSDKTVKIWDVESGRAIRTISVNEQVQNIAYRPDGLRILFSPGAPASVSGSSLDSNDSGISVWDAESGRELGTISGHSGYIVGESYNPDGSRIISVGFDDGTVRIWNTESRKEIARFIAYTNGEWACITSDGYYVASAKGDQYFSITAGGKAYDLARYRAAFNKPDLVRERLSGLVPAQPDRPPVTGDMAEQAAAAAAALSKEAPEYVQIPAEESAEEAAQRALDAMNKALEH